MKFLKKMLPLFLCLCFAIPTGCGKKETVKNIIAENITGIKNIDPQIAENDTEQEIVHNTFRGLLRHDENGKIITDAAESYSVSSDGLTYTFKISEKNKWQDGKPLGSEDFLFAFRRAADPATKAPFAYTLFAIKNFEKAQLSKTSAKNIGVAAPDSKTLKITLQYPCSDFPELLTTSVCMPCREDFVEKSSGYYGLKQQAILGNGEYKVSVWNTEYLQLSPSSEKSAAPDVYFYFNDSEKLAENVKKSETDYTAVDAALITEFKKSNFEMNVTPFSDSAYSLMANKKREFLNEKTLSALMSSVDFSLQKYENETYGARKSQNVLPQSINGYSESAQIKRNVLSEQKAVDTFREGCDELQLERVFPTFTILFEKNEITEYAVRQIAAAWQSRLGVTVNIAAVDSEEILNYRIANGDYDFAVVKTRCVSNSAESYLKQFTASETFKNLGFGNGKLNGNIKKLCTASEKNRAKQLNSVLKKIANDSGFYSLYTSSKLICTTKNYSFDICKNQAFADFSKTDFAK